MAKRVFRKGKKLSGGPKNFRKWADWDEGDYIIGKYMGIHVDQYDKECPIIEVADAEFSNKKEAKTLIDKTMILNATGQLNAAMEKMEEGKMYQFTYNGMSTIEKGKYRGKDAHGVEVEEVYDEQTEEDSEDERDGRDESDDYEEELDL